MQGTLILTILTIRSSYLREVEEPLSDIAEAPDTIQWWITQTGSWRIRTYALDHDIHPHSIGNADNLNLKDLALANAQKHYSDVIQSQHVIELINALDADETSSKFRAIGLEPRIEIASGRFAFWKPDDAVYRTQSQPK
ncbi:MAG TPA: hypothetical protein VM144_10650 [Aestuariivirga sp.]|nr:hypothetical protein [Aestuariivirga sp.]